MELTDLLYALYRYISESIEILVIPHKQRSNIVPDCLLRERKVLLFQIHVFISHLFHSGVLQIQMYRSKNTHLQHLDTTLHVDREPMNTRQSLYRNWQLNKRYYHVTFFKGILFPKGKRTLQQVEYCCVHTIS